MKESARRMHPSNQIRRPLFLKTLRQPRIEREKEHPGASLLRGARGLTLLSRSRLLLRSSPVVVVANIAVVADKKCSSFPNLLALEHKHETKPRH